MSVPRGCTLYTYSPSLLYLSPAPGKPAPHPGIPPLAYPTPCKGSWTRQTHPQKGPGSRHTHLWKGHGTRDTHPPVNRHLLGKTLPSRNFIGRWISRLTWTHVGKGIGLLTPCSYRTPHAGIPIPINTCSRTKVPSTAYWNRNVKLIVDLIVYQLCIFNFIYLNFRLNISGRFPLKENR